MTRDSRGLSPKYRSWSVRVFALECAAVIIAFLCMVFVLNWKITLTMLYILLLLMVVSAALLILTGETPAKG